MVGAHRCKRTREMGRKANLMGGRLNVPPPFAAIGLAQTAQVRHGACPPALLRRARPAQAACCQALSSGAPNTTTQSPQIPLTTRSSGRPRLAQESGNEGRRQLFERMGCQSNAQQQMR